MNLREGQLTIQALTRLTRRLCEMKRIIFSLIIVVLVAAIFLGSCGEPESTSTPTATPTASPTATPTAAPTETPKYGGVLRVITPMDPTVLGYPAEQAGRATYFQYCVLERLCIYAPTVWEDHSFQGILATSWEHANDMKTWTFHLREGVKFHDGTPWNATAAKWNADLQILEGKSTLFNDLESMETPDEYTVVYNFKSPQTTLLVEMATGVYFISPTSYEGFGATQEERKEYALQHPVGTGPFKLVDAVLGSHVEYTRFDDYWGGKPYLDGIKYLIVPDATVSKAMMEAGEADMYVFSEWKETLELEAMDGFYAHYAIHHTPEGAWPSALDPNSYFYDKRVREALEYAIDREAIVKAIALGSDKVEVMYQAPIPSDPAYRPDFGRKYDPEKAKQLLAEAGVPNGFETTIYIRAITGRWADAALMMQSMYEQVGIKLNIEMISPGQYMTYLLMGWPADTILFSGIPNEPIPVFVAKRDYRCSPPNIPKWNHSTVQTPEMCALHDALSAATTEEAVWDAYIKLSHQAMDDAVGIYMMDWPDTAVFADYVHDNDWCAYSTKVWNANTVWISEH
jgi:peptide/nickel transport system substrate-binding protein